MPHCLSKPVTQRKVDKMEKVSPKTPSATQLKSYFVYGKCDFPDSPCANQWKVLLSVARLCKTAGVLCLSDSTT